MLLVAALCFLTKLIYSSNTNSSCDTQSCEYGCYIDAATNQAICICPVGLTIKAEDLKTCVKIDTQIIFKETPVKIDGTIRPHGDQSKCFYHKMNAQCEKSPKLVIFEKMVFEGLLFSFIFFILWNGFTSQEKIYISDCHDHNRYQWIFDEESGLIMNSNRIDTEPHCWKIPNVMATRSKQQVFLAPCVEEDLGQQWTVIGGRVKAKSNTDICAMWNMKDKTRLWGYPCDEMKFSEMVVLK